MTLLILWGTGLVWLTNAQLCKNCFISVNALAYSAGGHFRKKKFYNIDFRPITRKDWKVSQMFKEGKQLEKNNSVGICDAGFKHDQNETDIDTGME